MDKLFNRNFIAACTANFLYFFGFYSLFPILALYLRDALRANEVQVGIAMACYVVAALCIRPFAGFFVDRLSRKPLYMTSLAVFVLCFAGYPLAGGLALFIFFRVLHGLSFGMLTVSANTQVLDITPSERRGAALGYYGIANTLAMAVGPLVSVYAQSHFGYIPVFYAAFGIGILAFIVGSTIEVPPREPREHEVISLDRFILLKGLPAGFSLFLLAIPYGMVTSYIALYSLDLGRGKNTALFYLLLAVGIVLSRFVSTKRLDRGLLTEIITEGAIITVVSLLFLTAAHWVGQWNVLQFVFFNVSALFIGLGYGFIFPAMNTLFVNLASHNQRGTANSTYMTTWDTGVGVALLTGAWVGEHFGFSSNYLIGTITATFSVLFFVFYVRKHFERNKLR